MSRRRLIAALSSAALAIGLFAGGAMPSAYAVDLGIVTVAYNGGSMTYTISPTSLSGTGGDTFTLKNTMNDNVNSYVSLVNSTGAVTLGGVSCTSDSSCKVNDAVGTDTTGVFTVTTPGVLTVRRYLNGGSTQTIGSLTVSGAGGSSSEPGTPEVTMTFDGNGGNCSSNPLEISGNGGATYNLPAEGSGAGQCRRDNYTLLGWSHEQDSTAVDPNLTPGATVTFANAGGTMYAVWQADESFSEITYDSNVGGYDLCWDNNGNNVDYLRANIRYAESTDIVYPRVTTVLESSMERPASQAVCKPPFLVLASWNTEPDGTGTAYELDQPLGEVEPLLRLYAQWGLPRVEVGTRSPSFAGGIPPLVSLANGEPLRLSTLVFAYGTDVQISVFDRLGRPSPNTLVPLVTQWPITITGADGDSFKILQSNSEGIANNQIFVSALAPVVLPSDSSTSSRFSLITWTASETSDVTGIPSFLVFPIYRS